jgi:hypothetical protein
MTHLYCDSARRIRASLRQWFTNRIHECTHCCQCDGPVKLWDSYCPICDQKDPVRHSKSIAVQLLLAFLLLTIVLLSVLLAF